MGQSSVWYTVIVSSICELIVTAVVAIALILFYPTYFPYVLLGAGGFVIIYFYVKYRIYKPIYSQPIRQPRDDIIGQLGVAITDLAPRGQIKLRNEIWSGRSESGTISQGTKVKIIDLDGIQLIVKPVQDSERR